jgi:proteasome accessory factor B
VDKSERLLNLTITLLDTERPLRAEEIRSRVEGYPDKLESFRRAFERDKDDLRDLGIPISLEPVPGTDPPAEGYRIRPEDYYLEDPGLEPDELAALHLATRSVRLGTDFDSEGLWKLGGLVGDAIGEGPLVELPPDPNLSCLFDATWTRRTVQFRYNDKARSVDPYRVELQRGWWYLIGFDHIRDEVRNFRVDRIDGAVTSGAVNAFVAPDRPASGMAASGWQLPTGEEVTVTIDVDADRVALFRAELGSELTPTLQDSGSARFEVPVTNWDAFRSFLLTYLDHAVVVGPADLRADMIGWLEAMSA